MCVPRTACFTFKLYTSMIIACVVQIVIKLSVANSKTSEMGKTIWLNSALIFWILSSPSLQLSLTEKIKNAHVLKEIPRRQNLKKRNPILRLNKKTELGMFLVFMYIYSEYNSFVNDT